MIRYLLLCMYIVLVCGLVACSGNLSETGKTRFAYIAKEREQSFHEGIVNGIKKEMAKMHITVDVYAAKNQKDIETQRQYIKVFAKNKKYDGVMICPNDSEALTQDIKALDDAGIPFLFIDTPLVENDITASFKNYCGYVGTDNFQVGKTAVQFIMDNHKAGNVVMVRGVHTHRSSLDREKGFVDEAKKHPELNILTYLVGDWKTEDAYQAYTAFMNNNQTPVDAVFAYNDHMAIGVSRYYEEHPQIKRPMIIGVDGTVVGQKGLLEKKIDAIIVQATELMGIEGLKTIQECVSTRPIFKRDKTTPVTTLTTTTTLQRTSP